MSSQGFCFVFPKESLCFYLHSAEIGKALNNAFLYQFNVQEESVRNGWPGRRMKSGTQMSHLKLVVKWSRAAKAGNAAGEVNIPQSCLPNQ